MMDLDKECRKYGMIAVLDPLVTEEYDLLLDQWVLYCKIKAPTKWKLLVDPFYEIWKEDIEKTYKV